MNHHAQLDLEGSVGSAVPLFSVVIPTRNRTDSLMRCLAQLAPGRQTLPPSDYEVIVADDDPALTAQTVLKDAFPNVKWVAGPGRGPASNRNIGARQGQGTWLAFIDDDCVPDSQWLASYQQAVLAHPVCQVFEGRVYVDRPRRSLSETAPINEHGNCLWSCNFLIKKSLFDEIHGFDERFAYAAMEDVEIKRRLDLHGRTQIFVRAASVLHPWRNSTLREQRRHYAATKVYLSIHPNETTRVNARYYLKVAIRGYIKELAIGLFIYGGRGLWGAMLNRAWWLWVAVLLAVKRQCVKCNPIGAPKTR